MYSVTMQRTVFMDQQSVFNITLSFVKIRKRGNVLHSMYCANDAAFHAILKKMLMSEELLFSYVAVWVAGNMFGFKTNGQLSSTCITHEPRQWRIYIYSVLLFENLNDKLKYTPHVKSVVSLRSSNSLLKQTSSVTTLHSKSYAISFIINVHIFYEPGYSTACVGNITEKKSCVGT
jgi:hypothetical protein